MRTARGLLAALMVLALCALPAPAAQSTTQPAEKKVKLPAYYAMLAKRAQLTYEQQLKLADALAERKARRTAWREENGPRLHDIRARRARAVEQNDEAATQELSKQRAELIAKWRRVEFDFQTGVRGLLQKGQLLPWEAGRITYGINMTLGLKKVKLDEGQLAQVQPMCLAAAGKVVKLEVKDTKQRRAVLEALTAAVIKDILTPEQRQLMAPPPKAKAQPAPPKKPAPG